MKPLVLDDLLEDVLLYGRCAYRITDNHYEFSIKRINPLYSFDHYDHIEVLG